jgi:hypothetical protein
MLNKSERNKLAKAVKAEADKLFRFRNELLDGDDIRQARIDNDLGVIHNLLRELNSHTGVDSAYLSFTLTDAEHTGLIEAIRHGLGDRENYLQDGNPHVDYGDEWPETARSEAKEWRDTASAVRKLNDPDLASSCEDLAESLEESAKEFESELDKDEDEDDDKDELDEE